MEIILILSAVVTATLTWAFGICPFIKQYTGGKTHSLWTNIGIYKDYFLAKKIVKGEKIKTPVSVRLFELSFLAIALAFILFAVTK